MIVKQEIESISEAQRTMKICNACRYCESYCAVFPAMELRREFSKWDVYYLANLCHDCRACYYSCQYSPPHEFDLNIPRTFSKLRTITYSKYVWPASFAILFKKSGWFILSTALFIIASLFLMIFLFGSRDILSAEQQINSSFYNVIPEAILIGVSLIVSLFALVSVIKSSKFFLHSIGSNSYELKLKSFFNTFKDVLTLRYLGGYGDGCNYKDESFSNARRWAHQMILYGFMSTFAATVIAAIYEHLLDIKPLYGYSSFPVILGVLGGISQIIGIIYMLWLKLASDRAPYYRQLLGFDLSFTVLLFFVNFSGLFLFIMRETSAMKIILIIHIGLVWTLFLYLPYSKFTHAIYRFTALVYYNRHYAPNTTALSMKKKY